MHNLHEIIYIIVCVMSYPMYDLILQNTGKQAKINVSRFCFSTILPKQQQCYEYRFQLLIVFAIVHVPRQLRRLPCCPALKTIGIILLIVIGKSIFICSSLRTRLSSCIQSRVWICQTTSKSSKRNKKLTKIESRSSMHLLN